MAVTEAARGTTGSLPCEAALRLWFIVATGLGLAFHLATALDADVATPLYQARGLLAGQRLYVDLLELNPPYFIYFDLPAALLARLPGIDLATGFHLYLHALILASLLLCLPLARRRPILAAGLPLVLLLLPGQAFGQREHIFLIFILPWLLLQARSGGRLAGPPLYAVWACLGLLMKPFFALVPLAVLLAAAWRSGSLRRLFHRDGWIMLAVLLGYVGLIALVFPGYLESVVPATRAHYGLYDKDPWLLATVRLPVLLGLVTGLLALRAAGRPGGRAAAHCRLVLLAAALGGFASYFAQRKGWEYHALPAVSLTAAFLLAVLDDLGRRRLLRLLTVLGLVIAVAPRWDAPMPLWSFWQEPIPHFVRQHPGLRFGTFSGSSRPGFPLAVYADAVWTLRLYSMMQVNSLYVARALGAEDGQSRAQHRTLALLTAEDIVRHRPDAIFVDRHVLTTVPFDFVGLLSEIPEFRQAWQDYGRCRQLDAEFDLWTRRDSGLCR